VPAFAVKDTHSILLLIALQEGLCAIGWWVAGWLLGLQRRVAAHWLFATLALSLGLALVVQRGAWPVVVTYVLANALIILACVAYRRGAQVFLRLPRTDRENTALVALDVMLMSGFVWAPAQVSLLVVGASVPIAWTLWRSASELYRGMRAEASLRVARAVAGPFAVLGLVFSLRAVLGLIRPEIAARPFDEANAFNTMVVMAFMLIGLVINMVLAMMVVARMVLRLQHLSRRDSLTGLLNRRAFLPLLGRQAGRLRRYGETYALLMIDIDHFKAINDTHGHAAGDAALVALATLLREAARGVDHLARLGGEEFCILLPHTDLDGAVKLGARVRESVRRAEWPRIGNALTVSVGVAVAEFSAETAAAVLERADKALYRAKADGRDRVVLAEPASFGIEAA
jgi:diguanylate cyclase (GGDEF)-like protein